MIKFLIIFLGIMAMIITYRFVKGSKQIGELMRRFIIIFSVGIFVFSLILIVVVLINKIGLSLSGQLQCSAALIVLMVICIFLFFKNRI